MRLEQTSRVKEPRRGCRGAGFLSRSRRIERFKVLVRVKDLIHLARMERPWSYDTQYVWTLPWCSSCAIHRCKQEGQAMSLKFVGLFKKRKSDFHVLRQSVFCLLFSYAKRSASLFLVVWRKLTDNFVFLWSFFCIAVST